MSKKHYVTKLIQTDFSVDKFIELVEEYKLEEALQLNYDHAKEWYYRLLNHRTIPMSFIDEEDNEVMEWIQDAITEVQSVSYSGADEDLKNNTLYQYLRSYELVQTVSKARAVPKPKQFF